MRASFPNSSPNSLELNENRKINSFVERLDKYKKPLLWGLIGCIALLILCYRLIAKQASHAEADFFQAQTLFLQLEQEKGPIQEQSAFSTELDQLDSLMQRHPELKARYEGPLAQELLSKGQTEEATRFAEEIFKRTAPDHLEHDQVYSQASLWIAEGKYDEALEQSQRLKETLDRLDSPPLMLYVFNLLRLAMLHQQLGHPQEELQIWEELQNQPRYLETFLTINQVFKAGQTSLQSYIEERKKNLSF